MSHLLTSRERARSDFERDYVESDDPARLMTDEEWEIHEAEIEAAAEAAEIEAAKGYDVWLSELAAAAPREVVDPIDWTDVPW